MKKNLLLPLIALALFACGETSTPATQTPTEAPAPSVQTITIDKAKRIKYRIVLLGSRTTFSSDKHKGSGFTNKMQQIVIITTDSINGGAIIPINSRFGISYLVYRYKF